jgi:hypothetical protein
MPLNSYVTLGRSGLRVSPFCLGAMTFGEDLGGGFGASVKDSEAILAHYLEPGWELHCRTASLRDFRGVHLDVPAS